MYRLGAGFLLKWDVLRPNCPLFCFCCCWLIIVKGNWSPTNKKFFVVYFSPLRCNWWGRAMTFCFLFPIGSSSSSIEAWGGRGASWRKRAVSRGSSSQSLARRGPLLVVASTLPSFSRLYTTTTWGLKLEVNFYFFSSFLKLWEKVQVVSPETVNVFN